MNKQSIQKPARQSRRLRSMVRFVAYARINRRGADIIRSGMARVGTCGPLERRNKRWTWTFQGTETTPITCLAWLIMLCPVHVETLALSGQ